MGTMTKHLHLGLAPRFALLLVLVVICVTACKDKPITCGVPGSVQECDCSDGRTGGSQTCREGDWTECACTGEIPGVDGGSDGEVDSGAGTDGGADASNNTDGGADTDAGAGAGGTGGTGGTSGTGGTGGTSGTGGTGGGIAAYSGPCAMTSECPMNETCVKATDLAGTSSYCATTCADANACAAPANGNSTKTCAKAFPLDATGQCQLVCDGLPTKTCPTGMTCKAGFLLLSASVCVWTN